MWTIKVYEGDMAVSGALHISEAIVGSEGLIERVREAMVSEQKRIRSSTWLVLILISVSMTGSAVANALNASLLLDLLDSSNDAGKATGLLITGGNVFGLLAPIVTGYVIAETGSYGGAFAVAGGLLIAGAVVVMTMTRRPIITRAVRTPGRAALAPS